MPLEPLLHVFIDEAGDPGVKEKAGSGADWTDWFTLSAVIISAGREPEMPEWLDDLNLAIRRKPSSPVHYRNLSDRNREHVCRVVSEKPLRLFVVASHKDTMRDHTSNKLGKATDQEFYNWCLRILLERVTEWCANYCRVNGLPRHPARIWFSRRGGHDYDALRDYLKKVEAQTLTGNLTLDKRSITPGVVYESLCEVVPHSDHVGLQFADIAASAFFQAACSPHKRHSTLQAEKLICRLARRPRSRQPSTFGLMLLPFPHQGEIPLTDRRIFELSGYRFRKMRRHRLSI